MMLNGSCHELTGAADLPSLERPWRILSLQPRLLVPGAVDERVGG
jgi:hypothetical protein